MLQHVEKMRLLRDDIDAGVRSLDAGKGSEVDMRDVVSRSHGTTPWNGCFARSGAARA